jgi:lysophospholipase L1-like esterase
MKTILAYGDSNTWGAAPMRGPSSSERFGPETRWPGVLQARLGAGFTVIAEGLNGRTTCLDDPVEGRHKNGETFLPVALESHAPLDMVIIKLGTNDLKARFSMTASDIAAGAGRLASIAKAYGVPHVMLVAPAPLARLGWLSEMFAGGGEKSARFAAVYAEVARGLGVHFFDAGSVIRSSEIDGIHLDAEAQVRLGEAIAAKAGPLLGAG